MNRDLTKGPVTRSMLLFAIPMILGDLLQQCYNIADTLIVGQFLGRNALAAVGSAFTLMTFLTSIILGLCMGSGALFSMRFGQRDEKALCENLCASFFFIALVTLLLNVLSFACLDGLRAFLRVPAEVWGDMRRYLLVIFMGIPAVFLYNYFSSFLRAIGNSVIPLAFLAVSALLNIALDPLFIFTFKLGISGAAIATLISQCISFSILLYFFVSGKSITKLSIRHVATHMGVYLQILSIGFPSFCRQGLASISTVALNIAAANYGDAAVAAMSIVGRIFFLVLAILIGFGHGFQPVVGYNYGAKRYGRVHEAFFFCVKAGTVFLACAGIAGFIFAPEILGLFRKEDAAVLAIGTAALRAQCAALPFQPLSVLSNMLFQSVGKPVQATFVAATRQGIYFIPLIIILPCFFGLRGVELTQCISDFLSFLSCIPLLILFFRDLRRREMQEGSCETH